MRIIDEGRREFIAKQMADIGKALLTVGFASYFFERFTLILRIVFLTGAIVLLLLSVFVYPKGGK